MISALDHVGEESYLLVENFRRVEVLLLFFFGLVCSLCHLCFVDLFLILMIITASSLIYSHHGKFINRLKFKNQLKEKFLFLSTYHSIQILITK